MAASELRQPFLMASSASAPHLHAHAAAATASERTDQKEEEDEKAVVLAVDIHDHDAASAASTTSIKQELTTLLRKLVGETLASFMVVFTIIAVKVNLNSLESDGAASLLALAMAGGMATMVTIFTLGHVSGTHINPVVTVVYTLIKHFPLQLAPLYICTQLIGGILASFVLEVVYKPQWNIVLVIPNGTALQAVLAEGTAGFLLLFVCASVATDTRAIGQFAGLAIGSIVALNIILVGPISGAGLNPARVLGPALVSRHFTDVWIYLVGPLGGGILGALLYLLLRPDEVRKIGIHKEIDVKEATRCMFSRFGWKSTTQSTPLPV